MQISTYFTKCSRKKRVSEKYFPWLTNDFPTTLGAETFAGRKFRDFRVFWHFSRKFLPRHDLKSKFAKVCAREITENSRLAKVFSFQFFVSSRSCVAVP